MQIDQTALDQLAQAMGVSADQWAVRRMLDQLWADVAGSNDITDAHLRFGEHVGMLGFAGTRWDDIQARMDAAVWNDFAEANSIERAAIRRCVERVLGQM